MHYSLVSTEGKFVEYLTARPSFCYFNTSQIAAAIRRPYNSVLILVREWRALGLLQEWKRGNEIYVRLDPDLR